MGATQFFSEIAYHKKIQWLIQKKYNWFEAQGKRNTLMAFN